MIKSVLPNSLTLVNQCSDMINQVALFKILKTIVTWILLGHIFSPALVPKKICILDAYLFLKFQNIAVFCHRVSESTLITVSVYV